MRLRLRQFLIPAMLLATTSVPTFAGSLVADYLGEDYKSSVSVSFTQYTTPGGPALTTSTYSGTAGRFVWNKLSGSTTYSYPNPFYTFCIDLHQFITDPTNFTEITSYDTLPQGANAIPMGSTAATDLSLLYGSYYDYVKSANLDSPGVPSISNNIGQTYSFATTGDERAAAFQLAVWEIVQDATATGSLDLASGRFSVTTPVASSNVYKLAKFLLDHLGTEATTLVGLQSTAAQDQIYLVPASAEPVPLPGVAAAAVPILMLGGTALKSKRRRQRAEDSVVA